MGELTWHSYSCSGLFTPHHDPMARVRQPGLISTKKPGYCIWVTESTTDIQNMEFFGRRLPRQLSRRRTVMIGISAVLVAACQSAQQSGQVGPGKVERLSSQRAASVAVIPAFDYAGSQPTPKVPRQSPATTAPSTTAAERGSSAKAGRGGPIAAGPIDPGQYSLDGVALAMGSQLPSNAQCAKQVRKTKEPRPGNRAANNTKPTGKLAFGQVWGSSAGAARTLKRVDGQFTGTTDEIIQWASCKWGFNPDVIRSQVFVESSWNQSATAGITPDQKKCAPGLTAPCPTAFGLLQLRHDYHPGTYPWSATSTAFNLDYGLAMERACLEGNLWFGPVTRGNVWGCFGLFYSGRWLENDGKAYAEHTKVVMAAAPWRRW